MNDVFPNKSLAFHLGHHHLAICRKNNDVVYIGTVCDIFFTPQRSTYKTLFSTDIEFGVAHNHFACIYIGKYL